MNKFQLILNGKINEALELYNRDIKNKFSSVTLTGRGYAYLYLNELDMALADFKMAAKVREKVNLGPSDGHQKMIGVVLWLKGNEQEAIDLWHRLVQDHLANKIAYSDMAGGVESGALLWFAACFEKFRSYQKSAEKMLKKKCKLKRNVYWPGPIAQYLLGNISEEDLKMAACKSNNLKERQLCQAYFYIGAKALLNDDDKSFSNMMTNSIITGPPNYMENEYFLARHELTRLKFS